MAKVKVLRDLISGEEYWKEVATGRQFRRMTGALVWPEFCRDNLAPGALVVLGETRARENVLGGRHLVFLLEEARASDVNRLVDMLARAQDDWKVRRWATPLSDSRVCLLDDYNDELRSMNRRQIRFGDPLGWAGKGEGLLPYYHALVQRRTMGEKTLFLGKESSGAAEIGKLRPEDASRKPTDFPGAAAVMFALAEIDAAPMPEWGERPTFEGGPADLLGGY